MKQLWLLPMLSFFLFATTLHAQTTLPLHQQKIANSVTDYFKSDRENIHLHLNKSIYLTSEQIWFKGYIIEKKGKPTLATTNVFISLLDEKGEKTTSQLYYAENNLFEGRIKLPQGLKSGKYYLQVYTNFMNNFSEDESSLYEITILNKADKKTIFDESINYDATEVSFFPESGMFLQGISNVFGIRVADCNGRGIAVQNAEILDDKENVVSTFSTDQFGYGKFEIYATTALDYKATFVSNGKKIIKFLPKPQTTGIAFSIDNYINPEKTIIKVKTNPTTLEFVKNKPYTLVFQQNEATTFAEFSFKENTPELRLSIPSSEINSGISAVSLIDQQQKEIGQRLIYKPSFNANDADLRIESVRTDSIVFSGSSKLPLSNLSISVLPSETIAAATIKTVQAGLQFDNYLLERSKNIAYYLSDFTRKKHYELDTYLLSQKSKYSWNSLLGTPPNPKFEFDHGLTVKGTVNSADPNKKIFKINMNSLGLGLNEFTSLDEKNEFKFEHLLAIDSTKIYFLVKDDKGKNLDHKLIYQVANNTRKFLKAPALYLNNCTIPNVAPMAKTVPFPKSDRAILLDSITVSARKKRLVNESRLGNFLAKGFKISEQDANSNIDVLQFIGKNGFVVSYVQGEILISNSLVSASSVYGKNVTTSRNKVTNISQITSNKNMENQPAIFIDDVWIQNFEILRGYSLSRVDEIYLNKNYSDISIYGTNGIIKIYTKKDYGIYNNNIADKSPVLIVKNGFQRFLPYQNPEYDNMQDEGFQKLGTIDWKPFVNTDENGNFRFTVPNFYQKSLKIIIQGLSADGEMVSEIKTLNIP